MVLQQVQRIGGLADQQLANDVGDDPIFLCSRSKAEALGRNWNALSSKCEVHPNQVRVDLWIQQHSPGCVPGEL